MKIVLLVLCCALLGNCLPIVDPGLFVIMGVRSCRAGAGYCLLGLDCTLDEDFLPDDQGGHCDGLRSAFTPSAHFICCRYNAVNVSLGPSAVEETTALDQETTTATATADQTTTDVPETTTDVRALQARLELDAPAIGVLTDQGIVKAVPSVVQAGIDLVVHDGAYSTEVSVVSETRHVTRSVGTAASTVTEYPSTTEGLGENTTQTPRVKEQRARSVGGRDTYVTEDVGTTTEAGAADEFTTSVEGFSTSEELTTVTTEVPGDTTAYQETRTDVLSDEASEFEPRTAEPDEDNMLFPQTTEKSKSPAPQTTVTADDISNVVDVDGDLRATATEKTAQPLSTTEKLPDTKEPPTVQPADLDLLTATTDRSPQSSSTTAELPDTSQATTTAPEVMPGDDPQQRHAEDDYNALPEDEDEDLPTTVRRPSSSTSAPTEEVVTTTQTTQRPAQTQRTTTVTSEVTVRACGVGQATEGKCWLVKFMDPLNSNASMCVGSYLESNVIVTSANCVSRIFDVGMGQVALLSTGGTITPPTMIRDVIAHEEFRNKDVKVQLNDIGLIRLEPETQMPDAACALCLPKSDRDLMDKPCQNLDSAEAMQGDIQTGSPMICSGGILAGVASYNSKGVVYTPINDYVTWIRSNQEIRADAGDTWR